ncbi:MAG: PglZ domain-containing protein [Muribaculum sp.]|nr:PglZ domain-containing protein [Muribaculum sp.]
MTIDRIYDYFERNPQLHVLFVFDKGFLEGELAGVEWPDAYHYEVFDGCWFNAKYAIENTWADKRVVLLFRQPYAPQSEEEYLKFPLLDLLVANMEYKEKGYASFLQQYNLPQTLGSFISRNLTELESSRVFPLIEGYLSPDVFKEDIAIRAFLSSYLNEKKVLEWRAIIAKMIVLDLDSEEKKRLEFYNHLSHNVDAQKAVVNKLKSIFGVSYSINSVPLMKTPAEILKYNVITRLLAVDKSDPYMAFKLSNSVAIEQMQSIYDYGRSEIAGGKFDHAMSVLAQSIKEEELISVYGTDATFFILTEKLGWPIINTLCGEDIISNPTSVADKARELRLKFAADAVIQYALTFMEQVATLYEELKSAGSIKLNKPEDYIAKYSSDWYRIDTCYRLAVEAFKAVIIGGIENDVLNTAKTRMDKDYAKFVNDVNIEWVNRLTECGDGYSSLSLSRQPDFYNEFVNNGQRKVIVVSDALRYEVAVQLMNELAKKKHIATLKPMLASLPTETEHDKPSLLPHKKMTLNKGKTEVDGHILKTTAQRTSQVRLYNPEAECITYEGLMGIANLQERRDFLKKPFVYVFHDAIDNDGHDSDLPRACQAAVKELAALVNTLHATLNVANVIVTSDHGFIFNDINFEDKDKQSVTEETIELKTRYYLTESSEAVDGVVKFKLSDVSKIESETPVYVAVPQGTNRFAAPGGYKYTHGGASLQEVLVPVIISKIKKTSTKDKVNVSLLTSNLNMVSSLLKFQIIQNEPVSMSTVGRTVICALYNGEEQVTEEKTIELNSTDGINLNNRLYDISLTLSKPVTGGLLQLKIWDKDDPMNPLIKENVKNNTFIEQDFLD